MLAACHSHVVRKGKKEIEEAEEVEEIEETEEVEEIEESEISDDEMPSYELRQHLGSDSSEKIIEEGGRPVKGCARKRVQIRMEGPTLRSRSNSLRKKQKEVDKDQPLIQDVMKKKCARQGENQSQTSMEKDENVSVHVA